MSRSGRKYRNQAHQQGEEEPLSIDDTIWRINAWRHHTQDRMKRGEGGRKWAKHRNELHKLRSDLWGLKNDLNPQALQKSKKAKKYKFSNSKYDKSKHRGIKKFSKNRY